MNCMNMAPLTDGNQEMSEPSVQQPRHCSVCKQPGHTRQNHQTLNEIDIMDLDSN